MQVRAPADCAICAFRLAPPRSRARQAVGWLTARAGSAHVGIASPRPRQASVSRRAVRIAGGIRPRRGRAREPAKSCWSKGDRSIGNTRSCNADRRQV